MLNLQYTHQQNVITNPLLQFLFFRRVQVMSTCKGRGGGGFIKTRHQPTEVTTPKCLPLLTDMIGTKLLCQKL